MSRWFRTLGLPVFLTLAVTALANAAGRGQEDLDKAVEARLNIAALGDYAKVIRLADSALGKGLDATNTAFAKKLLASVLLERAQLLTRRIKVATTLDQLRQDRQAALADLDKAIKADSKQPEAYLLVATLNLLPDGVLRDARDALDKAIGLGIADESVRAGAFRTRGEVLVEMNEPEKAIPDFDKAIELNPRDAAAYEDKAKVLDKLKRYDEAIAVLEKMRKARPDLIDAWLQQAVVHVHQQKLDAALEDLDRARKSKPEDVGVLLLRASVYHEKGDKKKALADTEEALHLRPGLPMVIRTHALMLADTGRIDAAAAELETYLRSNPGDTAMLLQLGIFQSVQQQSSKAVKTFSAVLAIEPADWQALHGRGDAYLNLGRQSDALADYEQALKLKPDDEGLLNNLAWLLATSPDAKLRDGRRAIRLATQACEANQYKRAYTLSTLAAAHAETGDFPSAIRWSSKAVEIGAKDQLDSLKKELAAYKSHEPWRETVPPETPAAKSSEKPSEEK